MSLLPCIALLLVLQTGTVTQTIKLKHAPIESALTVLGGIRWKSPESPLPARPQIEGLPYGITFWCVDEVENSLTVSGTQEAVGSIKQTLELMDIPTRPVQLAVVIYDASRTRDGKA